LEEVQEMMNIETVFLLGVLIGRWLMLWVLYWATIRILKVLFSSLKAIQTVETPHNEIIYIPPEDISDEE
jgi:hypothetical protein